MKKITLFILMFIASITIYAQAPEGFVYSEPFKEPNVYESKVVQCNNGYTLLLLYTKKRGIEVTVYNDKHVKVASNFIKSENWNPKRISFTTTHGVYEINGDLVMFFEVEEKTPHVFLFVKRKEAQSTLYRIIINAQTGKMKSERKLYSGAEVGGYNITLDPSSNNYTIACKKEAIGNGNTRIELLSFNNKHTQIAKAKFDSLDKDIDPLYVMTMTIVDNATYICTKANKKDVSENKLIFSKFNNETGNLEHRTFEMEKTEGASNAMILYNPGRKVFEMLIISPVKSESKFFSVKTTNYYSLLLHEFDIETLALLHSIPISTGKLSEYSIARWGEKELFRGLPMDMIINPDNTLSILFQESTVRTMTYRNAVYISSWLEKIGYLDLDGRGNELDGYVIRRQQGSSYPVYELSLFNRRNNFVNLNATEYTPGNTLNQGFGSFNFINTAKGNRYIIYNDNPLNFDIDDKEKVENSSNVSESNTICYSLKNGEWGKKYLYGAPENKRSSNFSFIYSGDYNSKTGLYATMMIKRVNERKETYIAWIPFD